MPDNPLNVLVVGSGMFTCGTGTSGFGTILPALFEAYKSGLVRSVTIAGRDPQKADVVTEKVMQLNSLMGTQVEVNYVPQTGEKDGNTFRKVLPSEDFSCAIVATPDHLHFEVTQCLLEHKIHCLVVKPLVPTLKELDTLIKLQEKLNLFCLVEFHKRYDEANLKIRQLIREGNIGEVLYFLVEYSQRKSIPLESFSSWVDKTNIFQYLGVHYVDLIHFLTDALPRRATALGQKSFLKNYGIDNYDSIQVLIEWDYPEPHPKRGNKFVSSLATNWVDPKQSTAMSDQKIKVIGTHGRIESEQKNRGLSVTVDTLGTQDINPYFSNFQADIDDSRMVFRGYGFRSIYQFLADTFQVVNEYADARDFQGLRATFRDVRASTAVIQAVNESLACDGKWVSI